MTDIYILSLGTWNRTHLIQDYESLIWAERYGNFGDFELKIKYTQDLALMLRPGNCLEIPQSDSPMWVETSTVEYENGKTIIIAKGRDLSAFFDYRYFFPLNFEDEALFTNMTPMEVARQLVVGTTFATGLVRDTDDILQNYFVAFGAYDDSDPIDSIRIPKSRLSDQVRSLANMADAGWGMTLNRTTRTVSFRMYKGRDRTGADILPTVFFSTKTGTLKSAESAISNDGYINSVWVEDSAGRTGRALHSSLVGWQRRISVLQASDVVAEDPFNTLHNRGREYLENARLKDVFTGELQQDSWISQQTYGLGDVVLVEDIRTNQQARSRIVEMIRTFDGQGSRVDISFRPEA